jgi:hypothetical protein|tara:strand:- start:10 stop:1008 length:999 start_codon:yes stop_codon:yes gene_type:complete
MNKTILTSLVIISFFYSHSQCIDGDCDNGNGVFENSMYSYQGLFKNGNFIEGQKSKVVFTKLANGNYSRKEILIFDGLFENGNIKDGTSYNEFGVKEYDGSWVLSDGYLRKDGYGLLYYSNGEIQFKGLFENGNIKDGISYNDSGIMEYDGSWIISNGYLYKDGKGIEYINGIGYKTNYKIGAEIVNQYDPNDIKGTSSGLIEINLETRENGTNELIPISIYGLNSIKKYVFDTGAETFDISPTMEKYLLDNKFINNDDYLTPVMTTGFRSDVKILSRRVRISNIKIGDYIVNNVVATINNSDDDPLLCGRALLQMKFKNVTWSPGKLVLER